MGRGGFGGLQGSGGWTTGEAYLESSICSGASLLSRSRVMIQNSVCRGEGPHLPALHL
jgi:hypothetical protein